MRKQGKSKKAQVHIYTCNLLTLIIEYNYITQLTNIITFSHFCDFFFYPAAESKTAAISLSMRPVSVFLLLGSNKETSTGRCWNSAGCFCWINVQRLISDHHWQVHWPPSINSVEGFARRLTVNFFFFLSVAIGSPFKPMESYQYSGET